MYIVYLTLGLMFFDACGATVDGVIATILVEMKKDITKAFGGGICEDVTIELQVKKG